MPRSTTAFVVTPHVGVWIETLQTIGNNSISDVTPHVGVWIETDVFCEVKRVRVSLPMWECGLKRSSQLLLSAKLLRKI